MIRDVWAYNLEAEMSIIRNIIDDYPCVAMDTEFPGVVSKPIATPTGNFAEKNYQLISSNVNMLKIIQLGLTFSDHNGNLCPGTSTWQFNFHFNIHEDMFADDSIKLLNRSGINFERHRLEGIDVDSFGELLTTSGIVIDNNVKWLTFHSCYDFAYLLKMLIGRQLPEDEASYFNLLRIYFPAIYDIKFMMRCARNHTGSLNDLADMLEVRRIGPQHQAGSDSLLTSATFFKMRSSVFKGVIDDSKYLGYIYGLGTAITMFDYGPYGVPRPSDGRTSVTSSITNGFTAANVEEDDKAKLRALLS
eukprot:TRINITY_DN433_c0_g1_i1.p1 TRINITY_DN433_c0_g1~~TRINITY_DN433_c0_g1_i1.p1  ORF type:complete len:304 (+),score=90.15 TRINITY_DN433_c0_g1_i1:95-1006(+)